ncbi:MAG: SMR family transporter [Brevinematales bacterium]|nr:SMR family transporter [Brevinematales bacterium]
MEIKAILSLIVAAVANVMGSTFIKYSTQFKDKLLSFILLNLLAILVFGGSFPFYVYGLSKLKLSVAQPIFLVISYLLIALVAIIIFKESYSWLKIFGMIVIIIGVIFVAKG